MKSLFVTSEAYPFAVSGGLGDVAGALPAALRKRFVGCRVVMPLYEDVPQHLRDGMQFIGSISVPVAWRRQYCGIFETKVGGVTYYLLDNQYYFKRAGLYGYYDDAERFAFFARAALEILPVIDYIPDIIHCNDWQTALLPVYHSLIYAHKPGYENIKTLLTIHNIQYQGKYGYDVLEDVFGIPSYAHSLLDYDGCANILKGGIESANAVNTVSPTYAKEIMDPWFSYGLDGILKERAWKLSGIINGIDTEVYNPATDSMIEANYSADDMAGKAVNKAALQKAMGLPQNPDVPLIGIVTRLVSQKGLDLVQYAMEHLLEQDVQFVILGSGDWAYENYFTQMAEKYPEKLGLKIGFIPTLAHQIYAGADLFLMPSKFEPCGLAQLVALRYGTLPIVRETGGLKDTIVDCGDPNGYGFTFQTYNGDDMADAVQRALSLYADKSAWNAAVSRAMAQDNSWNASAGEYIKLYKSIVEG
ncbi:MAG: glycogen synthase GlgA [Clostridia bacterium]|nr:glycogen synthase GlgA [Clostridia bacterium]